MSDLFPDLPTQMAPGRPGAKPTKPKVAPVRFGEGWCNAACMYAVGQDCDCPCLGRNHRAGFRCEGFAPEQDLLGGAP
jgi:hypothetical protein